jgi:hypothetical protein
MKAGKWAPFRLQEAGDFSIQAVFPSVDFGRVNNGGRLDRIKLSVGPA